MMQLKKFHVKLYMRELLRQPAYAAVAAAFATVVFIHLTLKIRGEEAKKNSVYFKPAFLDAILVYAIVHFGNVE